mgnify:CR=1 FL=1
MSNLIDKILANTIANPSPIFAAIIAAFIASISAYVTWKNLRNTQESTPPELAKLDKWVDVYKKIKESDISLPKDKELDIQKSINTYISDALWESRVIENVPKGRFRRYIYSMKAEKNQEYVPTSTLPAVIKYKHLSFLLIFYILVSQIPITLFNFFILNISLYTFLFRIYLIITIYIISVGTLWSDCETFNIYYNKCLKTKAQFPDFFTFCNRIISEIFPTLSGNSLSYLIHRKKSIVYYIYSIFTSMCTIITPLILVASGGSAEGLELNTLFFVDMFFLISLPLIIMYSFFVSNNGLTDNEYNKLKLTYIYLPTCKDTARNIRKVFFSDCICFSIFNSYVTLLSVDSQGSTTPLKVISFIKPSQLHKFLCYNKLIKIKFTYSPENESKNIKCILKINSEININSNTGQKIYTAELLIDRISYPLRLYNKYL